MSIRFSLFILERLKKHRNQSINCLIMIQFDQVWTSLFKFEHDEYSLFALYPRAPKKKIEINQLINELIKYIMI